MHEKSANIRNHSFNIAEFYTINEQRECAHDNDNVPAFSLKIYLIQCSYAFCRKSCIATRNKLSQEVCSNDGIIKRFNYITFV